MQAVTQRPIKFRLEVFKTVTGCGWGVRCLVSPCRSLSSGRH
jgi:hypothetical protein